jgi:plastocyanin
MMRRMVIMTAAAILFALSAAHGCFAAEYEITVKGMKFGAAPLGLKVGDVIVWRNDDMFRHSATARDGSFDVDLPPKTERRMIVNATGAIEYYCRFHTGMVAKLDVRQ